jgi:hypothetical protein
MRRQDKQRVSAFNIITFEHAEAVTWAPKLRSRNFNQRERGPLSPRQRLCPRGGGHPVAQRGFGGRVATPRPHRRRRTTAQRSRCRLQLGDVRRFQSWTTPTMSQLTRRAADWRIRAIYTSRLNSARSAAKAALHTPGVRTDPDEACRPSPPQASTRSPWPSAVPMP